MERRALIIGASGGIGRAIAGKLQGDGWETVELSRSMSDFDYSDSASVEAALARIDGPFDLIFVATGALEIDGHGPEKSLRQIDGAVMARQFAVNAIGPALILRHAARLLPRDREARLAVLSARVGSIGDNALGGWYSYRAAKAALNQIVHTAAIEIARTHPEAVCVALHPGTVETGLTAVHGRGHDKVTPEQAAANLLAVLDGLSAADTGLFFDWRGDPVEW